MNLAETVEVIPGRLESIEAHKAHGGLVAAVFPIHYPRALFRAFNIPIIPHAYDSLPPEGLLDLSLVPGAVQDQIL